MKSIPLRTEPTVRQADQILGRLERALAVRGATVTRQGLGLRFRMPLPWRAPRLGALISVTSGVVKVSAGAGEPWKVRYSLDFTVLRGLVALFAVVTVLSGLSWPRLALVQVLVALWLLVYGAPRLLAGRRFHRLVHESAQEVLERRRTPRANDATPAT